MAIYTFYKICCNAENEFVYVGSTINFTSRKNQHKRSCEKPKQQELNMKIYVTIREFGGWDNWTMTPIEYLECATKLDARIREQFWIEEIKPKLNCHNAFGLDKKNRYENQKHYTEIHREKVTEYHKEYNLKNKEKRTENMKKWYTLNYADVQAKRIKYRENNIEAVHQKAKEYRDANREHINELRNVSRIANRDKLNEKQNQRYAENRDEINEKRKQRRLANRDEINEKAKQYRDANRDIINENQNQRYADKKAALITENQAD